jgi:hypothetical protein
MKRHAFDTTSFVFGVVLGISAVGFFLAAQNEWETDGRWVLPAVLIALGVAGIAGAVSGVLPSRSNHTDADASSDEDAPSGEEAVRTP